MQSVVAVGADVSGNSYVAGNTREGAGVIFKLSPNGATLYHYEVAGFKINDMVTDLHGISYAAGELGNKFLVVKVGHNGTEVWRNAQLFQDGYAVLIDVRPNSEVGIAYYNRTDDIWGVWFINANGVSLGGNASGPMRATTALKFDSLGGLIWGTQHLTASGRAFRNLVVGFGAQHSFPTDAVLGIAPDANGNAYYVSNINGSGVVTKMNSAFAVLWSVTTPGTTLYDVVADANGNALVSGFRTTGADHLPLTMRFKADGNPGGSHAVDIIPGNAANDDDISVMTSSRGHVYVLTRTLDNTTQIASDVYLRKLSKYDLSSLWTNPNPDGSARAIYADSNSRRLMARNPSGNIFTAGLSSLGGLVVDKFVDRDLSHLKIIPEVVNGGQTSTGYVKLTGPVIQDTEIGLSSNSAAAIVPPTVTVPNGSSVGQFTITTSNSSYQKIPAVITAVGLGDSVTATVTVEPGNNAAYVSSSYPTIMRVGRSYVATFRFANTGQTTWDLAYGYKLQSQSPTDNLQWGANRMALTNAPVPPGGTGIFTASVTASTPVGLRSFKWRPIAEGAGGPFGSVSTNANILVSNVIGARPLTGAVRGRRGLRR